MNQQRLPIKTRKNMKKLLAELATRQSNWREEKTQQIIKIQRCGLSSTTLLRPDVAKVNRDLPIVKSADHSTKFVQFRLQGKTQANLINTNNSPYNGNLPISKRSITEKSHTKQPYFFVPKTPRDENDHPRYQRQLFLPKIRLNKKRSAEEKKYDVTAKQKRAETDELQTIEEQQPSTIKKEISGKPYKILQKEIY